MAELTRALTLTPSARASRFAVRYMGPGSRIVSACASAIHHLPSDGIKFRYHDVGALSTKLHLGESIEGQPGQTVSEGCPLCWHIIMRHHNGHLGRPASRLVLSLASLPVSGSVGR